MIKNLLITVIFTTAATFFVGCNKKTSVIEFDSSEFDNANDTIVEARVISSDFELIKPEGIKMVDDTTFIIFDKAADSHIAHLISTGGNHLASFGNIGQGPGEFLYPETVSIVGNKIYVYDFRQCMTHILDRDSIMCGVVQDNYIDCKKTLIDGVYRFNEVVQISNDEYIGFGMTDKGRIMYVKNDSCLFNYTDFPILVEIPDHNTSLWNSYACYGVSPDRKHIVVTNGIGMAFEILTIDGCEIKSHVVKGFHKPVYEMAQGAIPPCVTSTEESFEGFRAISLTTDGFYACAGGSYPDYSERSAIYFFDYDGNLRQKYRTDSDIDYLASGGSRLFAITHDDKDDYVLKQIILP